MEIEILGHKSPCAFLSPGNLGARDILVSRSQGVVTLVVAAAFAGTSDVPDIVRVHTFPF